MEGALLVAQGFALAGISTDIASWQFKKRKMVLGLLVASAFLWGFHFYYLWAHYSAVVSWLVGVRLFVATFFPREIWMYVFIVTTGIFFIFMGDYSLIAIVALLAATIATYGSFRIDDKYVRLWLMCGTSLWLVHAALLFSPLAIVAELIMLSSNVLGYYRYYIGRR